MSFLENLTQDITGIFSAVTDFISQVLDILKQIVVAIARFYVLLSNFNDSISEMIEGAKNGQCAGLPLNGAIATYHYLVGDVIFYLTYSLILFGCLFTVYKLGLIIYSLYQSYKENLTGGFSTKGGLFSSISKRFKF